ncbi:MAG: regulatory protein RecX [Candidatus Omnitrophota bacterium]
MLPRRNGCLLGQGDFSKAKNAALRLLKFRVRSEKEIRDKLKEKGYGIATTNEVVCFLSKVGLIDDALFARLWVESRLKRPFGLRRLKFELKAKGIEKNISENVLQKARESTDEKAVVQSLIRNRLNRMRKIPVQKARARLFGYLIRRGFSPERVIEVLGEEL